MTRDAPRAMTMRVAPAMVRMKHAPCARMKGAASVGVLRLSAKPRPKRQSIGGTRGQMICFELKSQIRGGKNNIKITRTGHRYPSATFARWKSDAVRQLWAQKPDVGTTFPDGPVAFSGHYWPQDRRVRDLPAVLDAVWSALAEAKVVANDSQLKICLGWTEHLPDKKNPRLVLRLERTTLGE